MNDPDPPKPNRNYKPLEDKKVGREQQAKDAKLRAAQAKVRASIDKQKETPAQAKTSPPEAAKNEQPYRPSYRLAPVPGPGPAPGGMGAAGRGVYQGPRAPVQPQPETMKDFSDRLRRDSKIPPPKPGREVMDAQRERQARDNFRVAIDRVARSTEKVNANEGNTNDGGKGGHGR